MGRLLAAALEAAPAAAAPPDAPESRLLRQRDPGAWNVLFEREMPAIFRYARSRVGDAAEAEDITSQVFAEAWAHAEAFRDQGVPARAWLFGIARNVVNSHRRGLTRRPPAVAIEGFDGAEGDRQMDPDLLDLMRALSLIGRSHAEVISLRFIHGLSLQEAAVALGTSVDGIKGRQARALQELKGILSEAG